MSITTKKKATIGVIAGIGTAAIALGAATFAAFSATQDGPDTTVTGGKLNFGASQNMDMNLGAFVPGGAPVIREMKFTNSEGSSLPGNVSLAFSFANNVDNGCDGDEEDVDTNCNTAESVGELPEQLMVTITEGEATLYNNLPLSGLTNANIDTTGLAPNESVTYTFTFSLPGSATNAVQGDSVTLETVATLVQSTTGS